MNFEIVRSLILNDHIKLTLHNTKSQNLFHRITMSGQSDHKFTRYESYVSNLTQFLKLCRPLQCKYFWNWMGTKNLLPSVLNVQHYRVVFGLELLLFTNLANICILNRNSPLGIRHYILFLYDVQTPGTKRFLFLPVHLTHMINLTGLKL